MSGCASGPVALLRSVNTRPPAEPSELIMARHERHQHAPDIEQLQLISDVVPSLISYVDRDLVYQFCNRAYSEWFGLSRDRIIGKPMVEVLGVEAVRRLLPHLQQALSGQAADFEVEVAYKHGGTRWIHAMYTPHHDSHGLVIGVVVLVTDISEQRRTEAALRNSEGRLRLFIEHAPVAIAMFDPEMRYLAASHRWRDDYHIQGEIIGRSHYDAFPEISERWKEVHRRGLSGEVLKAEEDLFLRADGTTQWTKWEVRPWYTEQGEIGGILIAAEEVTEQVQAKRALLESEAVLRTVTNEAQVGLVMVNKERRYLFANHAYIEILGLPDENIVGKRVADVLAKIYGQVSPLLDRAFAGEHVTYELRIPEHPKGGERFYEVVCQPRVKNGNDPYVIVVVIDVTERKKAERLKDEYLAMLAHELRNPLAPMLNAANLILRLGSTNPKVKRASEIMMRQVTHMARLLDDLLDVSRIARGKIILRKERFDLVELLRNAHEDHRSSIEGAGLSFRASLPDDALYVYADKTRLLQVVSNLLQNANKFTPAGGAVHLDLVREKSQVVIRVRDTGIGMPPELLHEIFEPFVQAATSLDRSKGGLGLGLALAKGIVQLHGGTIAAHSEGKGAGSTFEVKVPLADEHVDGRDVLDDAAESKLYRPVSGVMFSSRR
jgi:PAS domain S-box-containing protein